MARTRPRDVVAVACDVGHGAMAPMTRLDAIRGRLLPGSTGASNEDAAWLVETVRRFRETLEQIKRHPCAKVGCACCQQDADWATFALARLEEPDGTA